MADRRHLENESVSANDASNNTRSSRSSTLPSQQSPQLKHRHRHRHYNSLLHKTDHSYQPLRNGHAQTKTSSHSLHLSPLGEFLSPVKRNVTDGLNGVVGWIDRDKDKDKEWQASQKVSVGTAITSAEFAKSKQRKVAVERYNSSSIMNRQDSLHVRRSLEEYYNSLASQILAEHTALAESRSQMLHMFNNLDTTLSSLLSLQRETQALLGVLTPDSIPELTEESTKQLEAFRARITDIESSSIVKLQDQVEASKAKTINLGDRLAKVRGRIRDWEEREAEKNRRRRRTVGFVWGTTGMLIILTVLLLVWGRWNEQLEAREVQPKDWTEIVIQRERERSQSNSSQVGLEELLKSLRNDELHGGSPVEDVPEDVISAEENDRLLSSIFDEL